MEPGSLDCSLVSLGPFAQGAFFGMRTRMWMRGQVCGKGSVGNNVPFAKVFGKTKIMSFLKGPWERIASYSSM